MAMSHLSSVGVRDALPAGTGRLRNGNPPGDLRLARRCGARTREGQSGRPSAGCRQPAMKNGRCRLHGGKSTGPRTVEGLERCRRARLVHGGRGRAYMALRRDGMAIRRRINGLRAEVAARIAFDGSDAVRATIKSFPSPPSSFREGEAGWGGCLPQGRPQKVFSGAGAPPPPHLNLPPRRGEEIVQLSEVSLDGPVPDLPASPVGMGSIVAFSGGGFSSVPPRAVDTLSKACDDGPITGGEK